MTRDAVDRPQSYEYVFGDTERAIELEDEGLGQLYLCLGAPGVGKSFLLGRILTRLAGPGWNEPWGGLLLDPKQTLIGDVKKVITDDRLHVIGPRATCKTNILAAHLGPQDLGVALAMSAQSAGISSTEAYWINELKRLFGAGLSLLALLGKSLTLMELAQLFLGVRSAQDKMPRSQLVTSMETARIMTFDDIASRRRDRALSELSQFAASKGDNADTVRSFLSQVLSPFMDPDLDYVSDPHGVNSIADLILRDGKWVMLEVPRSALGVSRMLSTLSKVLFQRAVLERFTLYPGNQRRVFLFADEYAEVASDLPGEGFGDSIFFSQMRQFRVLAMLATQGVPMLENSAVKEAWKTILSNSAGKLVFRVADPDTGELASKLLGEADFATSSFSATQSTDGGSTQSGQQMQRRTAFSSDLFIQGMDRGQLAFVGTTDGRSRATARFVKVD